MKYIINNVKVVSLNKTLQSILQTTKLLTIIQQRIMSNIQKGKTI